MKITICDDSIKSLLEIEKLLFRFTELYKLNFEIEKFTDSNKVYCKIVNGDLSDIYILDMLMPLKSGIDIANKIRETEKDIVIIFTTSSDDFAMEAYGVRAIRYILKPIDQSQFYEAVKFALKSINIVKEPVYMVKTKEGLISIHYSNILYIENASRILNVHLLDGRIEKSIFIRKSFDDEIKGLIDNIDFIQVHKSYVVNMKYVEKILSNIIIMENKDCIPISNKRLTEVKRNYIKYITDIYR